MKFSEQWLREFVNPKLSTEELLAQLTMLGLEVDGVEPAAPLFSKVVVGHVTDIKKHPEADKLNVCTVDIAQKEKLQIVCGAPNVKVGGKYPLAQIGGQLPGGLAIKQAKLRGVDSFGMLCSAKELGLSEDASGLMVLPIETKAGVDLRDLLKLDDQMIEIDLTPNRGDCYSLLGVAREVAAVTKQSVLFPACKPVKDTIKDQFNVRIESTDACPRYVGRIIKNINLKAASPLWLTEKLRRSDIRSINPVVDIMNYVMIELGQPMHAFDLDKLSGGIVVRMAKEGESLELLDDSTVKLNATTLVIADQKAACAIAGIMGGALSAVSDSTKHVFLESAFFAPAAITGRARHYGKHTDSSHRFERGVDPELQLKAIERATALLIDIVGGEAGPITHEKHDGNLPKRLNILLRQERIQRLIGISLSAAEVESILVSLGMQISKHAQGWHVTPPSYRFDMAIEADLIEELARVYGYLKLPYTMPEYSPVLKEHRETAVDIKAMKSVLVDRGYQEAITYSFIDPKLQGLLDPAVKAMVLSNPISSDMSVMRTSLLPGLVSTLLYNLNRQQKYLQLFEAGLRFVMQDTEIKQEKMIAGLRFGSRVVEQWGVSSVTTDFYDIKGDVEALLALNKGVQFTFEAAISPVLHPGQSACIFRDGLEVGVVGALHPSIIHALDLPENAYVFELKQTAVDQGLQAHFEPLSRFPSIRRDIAVIVDNGISWQQIEQCIRSAGPQYLKNIILFDIYTGKGVTLGRKSVAMGLILQEFSRTLTDTEIEQMTSDVFEALEQKLGATRRE